MSAFADNALLNLLEDALAVSTNLDTGEANYICDRLRAFALQPDGRVAIAQLIGDAEYGHVSSRIAEDGAAILVIDAEQFAALAPAEGEMLLVIAQRRWAEPGGVILVDRP